MNKIVVIIPYFGKFRPSIGLFLESCKRNSDIDWLFFTDCTIPSRVKLNNDIKRLAEEKLKYSVRLERAYKLCDMKPMYGLIFDDYIRGYDFWGFGDTDVVYGNVFDYLKYIDYQKYDKINWMGHLCFMRNLPEINKIAMEEIPGTASPKDVLETEANQGYDERDFNKKCLSYNIRLYNEQWAADIDIFYWRMRCADIRTFHKLLDTKEIEYAPKNYSKQLFAVVDGRVLRIYLQGNKVHHDEFAYIHFRKEAPINFEDIDRTTYIISRDGFFQAESTDFENSETVLSLINKYNNQGNKFQELKAFLYQYYRKMSGKRGW